MNDMNMIEKAKNTLENIINSPDDFLFTARYLRDNIKDLLYYPETEKRKIQIVRNKFAKIIIAKLLGSLEANPIYIREIENVLIEYAEAIKEIKE